MAYKACGSASLYIKTLYFLSVLWRCHTAATVANLKIRYVAKTPKCVTCVFYSTQQLHTEKIKDKNVYVIQTGRDIIRKLMNSQKK